MDEPAEFEYTARHALRIRELSTRVYEAVCALLRDDLGGMDAERVAEALEQSFLDEMSDLLR